VRTDFQRPPEATLRAAVAEALAEAGAPVREPDWEWVESGSNSIVVLAGPVAVRDLLDQIHAIDPGPLTPHLATPRVFYGGPRWLDVLTTEVVPRLPSAARDEARCRIDALAALPPSRRVVNHGDLAGSNILWDCGRVVGVIDWDLTSHDDPAEDVASLATWHGWHLVGELADADTVTRAEAFRGCFPLQVIAFAILRERPADEIAHTIERALERLGKAPC
jgi:aminoglycoside phosphotransferase (APT) family kinase protein